ncbi:hypothetical protein [uncultured Jatrophihabitans sp.]|uniref:hypothetical protein n=1 Tax=uncultured Jatrophihabitans sp. TaxID=1610747 RepID=UPI0035CA332B
MNLRAFWAGIRYGASRWRARDLAENDPGSEAERRLQAAGLIPPVFGLMNLGGFEPGEERLRVQIDRSASAAMVEEVREVLRGLRFEVDFANPDAGIMYADDLRSEGVASPASRTAALNAA